MASLKQHMRIPYNSISGYHILSGVEYDFSGSDDLYDYDAVNDTYCTPEGIVRFCIDGILYEAYYDAEDGYRSSMTMLIVSDRPIKNTFPPQPVYIRILDEDPRDIKEYNTFDVHHKNTCIDCTFDNGSFVCIFSLDSIDFLNSKLILKFGTNHDDSYYPCAICEYHPENLPINKKD